MKVLAYSINEIFENHKPYLREWNGCIYHSLSEHPITEFMMSRLGQTIELVVDCRDEYGCKWMPWMIKERF